MAEAEKMNVVVSAALAKLSVQTFTVGGIPEIASLCA